MTRLSILLLLLSFNLPAHALLAGASPDSPLARVDANSAASSWAGVGSVSINGSTYTGTLIAPGYVLTAAHVASGVAPENISFNLNAGGDLTQQIGVSAVYTAPGYAGFNANGSLANDLAIIKLATPVAATIPVYGILHDQMPAGTTLTFVGYGASGGGDAGVTVGASSSVKRVGQNNADRFVIDSDGQAAVYYFDFDGPDSATSSMGGITLGNAVETTVGSGDSGSPAFYQDANGKWWLAGMNTFSATTAQITVAGTFGTAGGGQVLSSYTDWIDSVVTPIPEPESHSLLAVGLGLLGVIAGCRVRADKRHSFRKAA